MTSPTLIHTVNELNNWCAQSDAPIASIFTMGALHAGHAQLVTYAKSHTPSDTRIVATIFVNPTQFNSSTDLAQYPRTLENDLEILASVGVDAVFVPNTLEMYPNGLVVDAPIDPGPAGEILESKSRPGHFLGMLTIVHKLLEITRANYSFFGEKDFQQLTLVREMVKQLALPIKIIGVPTVRDGSGLALSSRNRRLSQAALHKALSIPTAMQVVAEAFSNGVEKADAEALGRKYLAEKEITDLDYLEICAENLLDKPSATNARVFIAVNVAGVRLIDNLKIAK